MCKVLEIVKDEKLIGQNDENAFSQLNLRL